MFGAVLLVVVESIDRKSKLPIWSITARAGSGEEPEEEEAGRTTEPTPTDSIPNKSPILVAAEGGGGRGGGG